MRIILALWIVLACIAVDAREEAGIKTPLDRALIKHYEQMFEALGVAPKPKAEIPQTLHFVWLGPRPFPEASVARVRHWIEQHPGWKVKFWTDYAHPLPDTRMEKVAIEQFPLGEMTEFYYASDNFGERSMLLRYAILESEGGVYIDHDADCLKTIEPVRGSYDFFCGLETPGPTVLSTSVYPSPHVIGATVGHPILKASLNWLKGHWHALEASYAGTDEMAVMTRVMHRSVRALAEGVAGAWCLEGRKDAVLAPAFFSSKNPRAALYAVHEHAGKWHQRSSEAELRITGKIQALESDLKWNLGLVLLLALFQLAGLILLWKKRRRSA